MFGAHDKVSSVHKKVSSVPRKVSGAHKKAPDVHEVPQTVGEKWSGHARQPGERVRQKCSCIFFLLACCGRRVVVNT